MGEGRGAGRKSRKMAYTWRHKEEIALTMPQQRRIDHEKVALDSLVGHLKQTCAELHIEYQEAQRGRVSGYPGIRVRVSGTGIGDRLRNSETIRRAGSSVARPPLP